MIDPDDGATRDARIQRLVESDTWKEDVRVALTQQINHLAHRTATHTYESLEQLEVDQHRYRLLVELRDTPLAVLRPLNL